MLKVAGLWPGSTVNINYTYNGAPRNFNGLVAADSTVTLTGLCAGYPTGTYGSFVATIGGCTDSFGSVTLIDPPVSAVSTNPTICGKNDGSITVYNLPPDSTFIVNYTGGAPRILTVDAGDDSLHLPTLGGGTYNVTASIHTSQCSVTGVVLTNPPISATFTNPTICGKNDGTITLYTLPADSTFTVTFSGPGAGSGEHLTVSASDSLVIPGLLAGAYPSSYTSIIATINGVQCPLTSPVTLIDPAVVASFDTTIKLGCRGDQVSFTSTSEPAGYHNTWSFGDGTTTTTDNTNVTHLYNDYPADSGTYVVTLTYQTYPGNPACTVSQSEVVHFNHVIAAAYTPVDTTVCLRPASPISFANHSYGTSLSYAWSFGDGTFSSDAWPTHSYQNGGIYQTSLTVTDFLGCDSTVYGSVDVIKIDIHTVTHDTTVCLVAPLEMIAHPVYVPGTFTSVSYAWTPNNNLQGYSDTITHFWGVGLYQYTVTATTTPLGCVAVDTETINSMPPIVLTNLTANQTIMYGNSLQLNADGADYYEWFPADGTLTNNNINDPVGRPLDSTTYMVVGTSIYGCRDTGYITITIDNDMYPFIPTAFTPNNDGLNDKFHVVNLRYDRLVEMRVFDRWGVEMFHTSDGMDGWDGTFKGVPQDMGTYTWEVIIAHVDGTTKTLTGTVTLLR
jgi:gliding motility-associated-like protein